MPSASHIAPHTHEADLALARRCADGEARAQKELFRGYRARVHQILYRILGSNSEIDDLIQEVFWEVFRSLPQFRGEARLSTWMGRITTRVAFAHVARRRPAMADLDAVPEPAADVSPIDDQVMAREAATRLYRALDRLDPKHRVAFALHAIDGNSLQEVADMMDASLVATKTRVWRARRAVEQRARKDSILCTFVTDSGESRSNTEQEDAT